MQIALEPLFLIVPFLLTGVWVVLYRARRVDVHVYHHTEEESAQQPATRPTVGTTRYRVVDGRARQLSDQLTKIEHDLIEINESIRR